MIAEYALTYGGPPDREMAWPMFQLLLSRANSRFARDVLAQLHRASLAIAQSFGGNKSGQLDGARREIERAAFPGQKAKGPVFALKQSKEEDADG